MKRTFLLALSALILLLSSCTEEPILTLRSGNNSIDIPSDGGSASISITCNNTWSAGSSASWISVSPSSGTAGDNNISISIAPNTETAERQGVVTVQSEGLTLNINVKQAQANAIILSQKDVNFSDEGGSFTVNVKANVNYSIDISNGTGWLENIGSKALTSKDYTFSVSKNEKYDDRTAVITFKDSFSGISESVTVHQAQKGAIILTKDSVQIPAEGGSINVELKASLTYSISIISGSDWVKSADTKALITSNHTFSVLPNESYDSRTAVVVFSSTTTSVSDTLTIRQAHLNGLIVSEHEKYFDAEGGIFEVELQSNVDYTVVMPVGLSWLKQIDTKALETFRHSFSVAKNETYDDRSAYVAFKSKDGKLTDTLLVTQRQSSAIILTKKVYSLDDDAHNIDVKVRSNIAYNIEMPGDVDWVSEVSTKALKEYNHIFHVSANPSHAYRSAFVYFKSEDSQLIDSLVIEQGVSNMVDLSRRETANCYIVEKEGSYSFNASVIGNGNKGIMIGRGFHTSDATITPTNAVLLWQDHEIVSNISLQDGRVFFTVSAEKGNAVIAVTDADGVTLWSWHIWATDKPQEIRLTESSNTYLDRNLGATTTKLGLESSYGLQYQWGRKDPFQLEDHQLEDAPIPLTINDFIKNPTIIYKSYPWTEPQTALWGNPDGIVSDAAFKTIYDPCPPGYTIPTDGSWSEIDNTLEGSPYHRYHTRYDPSITVSRTSEGLTTSKNGKTIVYPWVESIYDENKHFSFYYRNSWYTETTGYVLNLEGKESSFFSTQYSHSMQSCGSIRCIKEESYSFFPPTVETLDASQVKITDLVFNGHVTNNGNTPVTTSGFYWGLTQNDVTNRVEVPFSVDGFNYHLDGLPVHSSVFVRAFAENAAGCGYGELKIIRMNSASQYAKVILDSLSRFMVYQYRDFGQPYNGEGTIRLLHGDCAGSSISISSSSNSPTMWNSIGTLSYLTDANALSEFPLFYYYRIINKVNTTIDNYLTYADSSDPEIGYYKAALLGYRAYAYLMLSQIYCKSWDSSNNGASPGLPLRVSVNDDVTTVNSTLAQVYQQIYADLETAINSMNGSSINRNDVSEIDIRTLYAVFAKAALNRKDYTRALDYAKLARSTHSLMSNSAYNSGFSMSNPEWIWGAYPDRGEKTIYYYSYFAYIGYNSRANAVRTNPKCINKELFDRIPATDIRKKLFLDPADYSYDPSTGKANNDLKQYAINYASMDGRKGFSSIASTDVYAYMQFKFANTYQPGGGQLNYIRAAEMVLIEAEANYYLGNESETRSLMNYLIRESGRDEAYTCTKSGEALLDELKFYRRIELWGEGFDWFDTKRWGDTITRKSFAEGGNFRESVSGTWNAVDKNDFVCNFPDNYQTLVRTGSE